MLYMLGVKPHSCKPCDCNGLILKGRMHYAPTAITTSRHLGREGWSWIYFIAATLLWHIIPSPWCSSLYTSILCVWSKTALAVLKRKALCCGSAIGVALLDARYIISA